MIDEPQYMEPEDDLPCRSCSRLHGHEPHCKFMNKQHLATLVGTMTREDIIETFLLCLDNMSQVSVEEAIAKLTPSEREALRELCSKDYLLLTTD